MDWFEKCHLKLYIHITLHNNVKYKTWTREYASCFSVCCLQKPITLVPTVTVVYEKNNFHSYNYTHL